MNAVPSCRLRTISFVMTSANSVRLRSQGAVLAVRVHTPVTNPSDRKPPTTDPRKTSLAADLTMV